MGRFSLAPALKIASYTSSTCTTATHTKKLTSETAVMSFVQCVGPIEAGMHVRRTPSTACALPQAPPADQLGFSILV